MADKTDEAIAKLVQNGDNQEFGLLVERYEQKMFRYARKFLLNPQDSEDLVQEVFIKAFINIQGFNARRRFSPWLYRIAHNEFINALKKKGREPVPFFDSDTLFSQPIAREKTDSQVNAQDLQKTIGQCLEKLDPKYREPLVLYFYEDMDYQAIAEVLQIPMSTVGVRLKRAKEAMRRFYNEINYSHGERQ